MYRVLPALFLIIGSAASSTEPHVIPAVLTSRPASVELVLPAQAKALGAEAKVLAQVRSTKKPVENQASAAQNSLWQRYGVLLVTLALIVTIAMRRNKSDTA